MTDSAAHGMGPQRTAVLTAPRVIRMQTRPIPQPEAGEVLVQVRSVGICGSDVHYYEDGRIGDIVVDGPLVLGHEVCGVIAAVGAGVDPVRVGARVALEPGVPCGHCAMCRTGRYNLCPDVRFFATPPIDGAFAEYVTLDGAFAHDLPDNLSDDEGALIEPLSVAVYAVQKAWLRGGEHVLVTGAGPVGLLCVQAALALGAARVTVADLNPSRLALAREFGAMTIDLRERTVAPDLRANALLECSGAAAALSAGLAALEPASLAVAVGMGPHATIAVPIQLIQSRELVLTGTFRYAHAYPVAIALASSGRIRLGPLITGSYGLSDADDALQAAKRDPSVIKAIVHPQQDHELAHGEPGTPGS